VDPADKAAPVDPVDKAVRVDPVGRTVRPIGRRADPMAAISPPLDRAENAGPVVLAAQAVRADLAAVGSDLQPSLSQRNKSD